METNKLKKFATEARHILIQGIVQRFLALGFSPKGVATEEPQLFEGGATFMGEVVSTDFFHKWTSLHQAVQAKGIKVIAEEAAYTWFNRLVAIRIMVKNRLIAPVLAYESEDIRIPVLVSEARQGRIPPMDERNREILAELLNDDSKTNEQFSLLIVAFCHATPIIHRCFGQIADYTELLLPTNILAEGGFVDLLNHTQFITDEDYHSPELIGWLYQFYISERKDEIFAKKGKFEADEIPAATQIFTPNWIVKYMVENTLGRIYLDNNPYSDIKQEMRYLVDTPASGKTLPIDDLAEMKVADFACGSGHILNECFDLLYKMYVEEGYNRRKAIEDIFRKNIIGIDLDTRAKQLAQFALLMKACQKENSFRDGSVMPRIYDIPRCDRYTWRDMHGHFDAYYRLDGCNRPDEIDEAFQLLEQADTLGSIIRFSISEETEAYMKRCIRCYEEHPAHEDSFTPLMDGFRFILALTDRYAAVCMNPPYMGGGNMNKVLSKYVKKNYEEAKADLFSVFMDVAIQRLQPHGRYSMINMQSWMFLSSFEKLRKNVLDNYSIESMLHLGPRTFDELSGEVVQNTAFVIARHTSEQGGIYFRLVDGKSCAEKERMFLQANVEHIDKVYYPNVPQANFEKIPGCPIGYWVSETMIKAFKSKTIDDECRVVIGIKTGDNDLFIRNWFEVDYSNIDYSCKKIEDFNSSLHKWFPYVKGGEYRLWYGNQEYVLFWKNNGDNMLNHINKSGVQDARVRQSNFPIYGNEFLTWSRISSTKLGIRFVPQGLLFDCNSPSIFFDSININYVLGLLSTKVTQSILSFIAPTLSFQIQDIKAIPLTISSIESIASFVQQNISISKQDWDAHETSWDFETNPLLTVEGESLEERMTQYKQKWEQMFMQLHANEEELNRQFIDIYGLQDELTPDVPLDEVTILQQGEISVQS